MAATVAAAAATTLARVRHARRIVFVISSTPPPRPIGPFEFYLYVPRKRERVRGAIFGDCGFQIPSAKATAAGLIAFSFPSPREFIRRRRRCSRSFHDETRDHDRHGIVAAHPSPPPPLNPECRRTGTAADHVFNEEQKCRRRATGLLPQSGTQHHTVPSSTPRVWPS